MYANHELLRLWSNDRKRRDFINDYKEWGIWFTQPELDLTFYKYELPGGGRIVAMEYLRTPYPGERANTVTGHKFYLQRGKHFIPNAASEHEIAGRLMELKAALMKERSA